MWDTDIWRLELNSASKALKRPERFISSTYTEINPQYSPDGTRIVFSSNRSGTSSLWVCESDGSHPVEIASIPGKYLTDPFWSPDGTNLAFKARKPVEVWTIASTGGRPKRLVEGAVGPWSRDGKWIYFGRDASTWKVPVNGGTPVRLSNPLGGWTSESPDGNFHYFTKTVGTDMATLWRAPVSGGVESQILGSFAQQYAITKAGIYFFTRWNDPELKLYRFDNGQTETIAQIEGTVNYGFSVSPDERWLLYTRVEHPGGDLVFVENLP
jgi:Tol biopolymer transport system component